MPVVLPPLPFAEFPLRPHRNGQWYKSVWNPRTKKSEQFYFGSWQDDPKGESALHDPELGWLARRQGILDGTDNVRVGTLSVPLTMTLGELMARFLTFKRSRVVAHELSYRTLGDYMREVAKFVAFLKPRTPVAMLRPEHFSAYMTHLIEARKLGRYARKRVRTYLSTLLRFGAKNDWFDMPNTGADWVSPGTTREAVRQEKLRAGKTDYSDRIVTGAELDKLLARSNQTFKAILLVSVNAGLGPADIGRLRWNMIDMKTGRMTFARPKTGIARRSYLWKKTRRALRSVRSLNANKAAIEREGENALVFLTRRGEPYYREVPVEGDIEVDGKKVRKLLRIKVENAVSITFRRMARELELKGLHFYRLRHSFKTMAKKARDREALDVMMGHADNSVAAVYDHEVVSWSRIRRVSKAVYRRLWPKLKQAADKPQQKTRKSRRSGADGREVSESAGRT
jgi:integrase